MSNSVVRTLKRIAILSVAGAIALSASTMTSPLAFAASPSANNNGQMPLDQQKQPQKNKQGSQSQSQKNGQVGKNQPAGQLPQSQQQVQQLKNQNGGQPQYQGGQQPKNNQNGQQFGQWQSNQPPKNQTNGQAQNNQNSQWQSNQQPKNQMNGQTKNSSTKQRYDWSSYQPGHQPPQWQQHRADFDAHTYQWNRTSNQRYHYQNYERPHGWYAQRWVYGQILPTLFWSQAYWLTSYYNFGLIDPPYGYVWVQNGNDALLVNVQNGQILSVEYNVFYS